ncbi:MAG: hypothetical protein KDA96_25635, partial [Planctomycetaceae bacterium]|nr:hypothetical protein [Planctomycetaceae bacterium]
CQSFRPSLWEGDNSGALEEGFRPEGRGGVAESSAGNSGDWIGSIKVNSGNHPISDLYDLSARPMFRHRTGVTKLCDDSLAAGFPSGGGANTHSYSDHSDREVLYMKTSRGGARIQVILCNSPDSICK